MVEYPSQAWKDYELIDSGNGRKLERFGRYIMSRPEPKALWEPSMTENEWAKLCHTVFTPGAGFGKNGDGWFRLTAFGTKENTVEAMNRLKKLLK